MKATWSILLLAAVLSGCVTKTAARREAEKAVSEAQRQAKSEQEAKEPAVWFRGDVKNPRVPWTEGLTLSQALLTAHYTWTWDPHLITVTRQGEVYQVNARRLLRGQDDPLLEP